MTTVVTLITDAAGNIKTAFPGAYKQRFSEGMLKARQSPLKGMDKA
jgi:hypothetical protein